MFSMRTACKLRNPKCAVYLPASCAIAGIMKTDTMLTGAAEVDEEAVNKITYSRYPSLIRAFLHLNSKKKQKKNFRSIGL